MGLGAEVDAGRDLAATNDLGHQEMTRAEGGGFEPPGPLSPLVFKTSAIVHSAIPPAISRLLEHLWKWVCQ